MLRPLSRSISIISVLGGPGSGKGTQSKYLSKTFGIPHISAGDLLREEMKNQSKLSTTINQYINSGKILPASITSELIEQSIQKLNSQYLILDGFPRNADNLYYWIKTYPQYPFLSVVYLNCSDNELFRRLSIRKLNSGRSDDNDETIRKRIEDHFTSFKPVEDYFRNNNLLNVINVPDNVDKLYTFETSSRGYKVRILSKLLEIPMDIEFIKRNEGNKTEEYLKLNPVGRVPTLVTDEGVLTESNAICRYLCRLKPEKKFYGKDFLCAGEIDDIVDWCANEFEDPSIVWAKTASGAQPYVKDVIDNAKADVKEKMLYLEEKLKEKEYLVDNTLSMADICMFCMLVKPYTFCFYPEYRVCFNHVNEWFSRINSIPEVESVVGKIKLCEKEVEFH